MRLKYRTGDFRVRELLDPEFVKDAGPHTVYRVTKRKLTTPEAISELAAAARVQTGDVKIAGLKDRQGITTQHATIEGGPKVRLQEQELRVEPIGYSTEELTSRQSSGNAFDITVRDLRTGDLDTLRRNVPTVREGGLANYFDDQRFGNLTHGQGWIALELMHGRAEEALKAFVAAPSPFDDDATGRFKRDLRAAWGDWEACLTITKRRGWHRSIFTHLTRNPGGFAGAFTFAASRLRLIHLYAYQSHLWNRAVSALTRDLTPVAARVLLPSIEGPLVTWEGAPPGAAASMETFRIPGPGLEDVVDTRQRELLVDALAKDRLVPDRFRIEGVSGFQLKGEDRPLTVVPRYLRVRPADADSDHPGRKLVRMRFELPRGSYATLVVKRLFARSVAEGGARGARDEPQDTFRPQRGQRGGQQGGDRRGRGRDDRKSDGRKGDGRGGSRPRSNERGSGRGTTRREGR